MHRLALVVCLAAWGCSGLGPTEAVAPPAPRASEVEQRSPCSADFDEVRRLLESSYPGYADKVERLGEARVVEASRVPDLEDREACSEAIGGYLEMFDDGHLGLADVDAEGNRIDSSPGPSTDAAPPEASFTRLSARVVSLRLPSFTDPTAVEGLVKHNRLAIRRSEHLLIDLRGNGGGSDASYEPLMKYVYSQPYEVKGVDVLATADNLAAWERLREKVPDAVRPEYDRAIASMREHPGELVELSPDRRVEHEEVLPLPRRVSVIHDPGCASACEQFLLAARQSSKVTTYGQPSAGVLDYANVRHVLLPSEQRVLTWPTTRSRRLPEQSVDAEGIAPDVVITPQTLSTADATSLDRLIRARRGPA